MEPVALNQARFGLSRLIAGAEATGEPVVLTAHGKPVAHLVPLRREQQAPHRDGWPERLAELWAQCKVAAAIDGVGPEAHLAAVLGASSIDLEVGIARLRRTTG